jgi:hypothetical protein
MSVRVVHFVSVSMISQLEFRPGADPGFQVRGAHLKNVYKWNFCEDFLLKSCPNVQAMDQDYVHEKIWIFRFYI